MPHLPPLDPPDPPNPREQQCAACGVPSVPTLHYCRQRCMPSTDGFLEATTMNDLAKGGLHHLHVTCKVCGFEYMKAVSDVERVDQLLTRG